MVHVVGAGLAGSEAAWQVAQQGVPVKLYEMRPKVKTPAHHTPYFAELVCSNSLRSNLLTNAVGILKEEMRRLGSVILKAADLHQVPAGGALAVDREGFAVGVTQWVREHPLIEVLEEEVRELPQGIAIIATGPLTSPALAERLQKISGDASLYFYDAAAPIVTKESLDMGRIFVASRYDKGEAAYLNCPMTEEEFTRFYTALITAEEAPLHDFEEKKYFEGCMPIEVMAKRGLQTLLFGPMKPVGLTDPNTGRQPFAVVQLRQDNAAGTLFNLVGFQTHLKWGEQSRVFRLIPGLEQAEFVRFGVIHRNTFVNSPRLLLPTYQMKNQPCLFLAGQMTGVEGYVESAASGLIAGWNAGRLAKGQSPLPLPRETVIGSMAYYISHADADNFQPMNANFGLLPPLEQRIRNKQQRYSAMAEKALAAICDFSQNVHK